MPIRVSVQMSDKHPAASMDKTRPLEERNAAFEDWLERGELAKVRFFLARRFPDIDGQTLDEITQDAIVKAYHWVLDGKYEDRSNASFTAFVTTIAKHACKSALKRERKLCSLEDREENGVETPSDVDLIEQFEEELDELEAQRSCEAMLADLPAKKRQILEWRYVEQMQFAEIAERMHSTVEAVKKMCHRTLAELSNRYGTQAG